MSTLDKRHLEFDRDDVQLMSDTLEKFDKLHPKTGGPSWGDRYVTYLPVYALAMLKSQQSVERLTKVLIVLTAVLLLLTAALLLENLGPLLT